MQRRLWLAPLLLLAACDKPLPVGRFASSAWTLAARPGKALANVATDRWMYLNAGGAMTNRTTISKLGVILVSVTERFAPEP